MDELDPEDQRGARFGLNLGAGMIIGLVIGLLAATLYGKREGHRARAGWNLVPVIVVAEDLPAGSVIRYDNLAQRPIPEQFVTASVVRPDVANKIVGKRVAVELHAGDPMMWNMFEPARCQGPAAETNASQPRR